MSEYLKSSRIKHTFTNKNVGIGTLSPSQLLHIFNTSTAWGAYANIRLSSDGNEGNNKYCEIGYFRGDSPGNNEALVYPPFLNDNMFILLFIAYFNVW